MKELHVVGAAIVRDGECLAARRSPTMPKPGKWEFPGGKVEEGESARDALRREIREELGLVVEVGELLATGREQQQERIIVLDVYEARLVAGELALHEHDRADWFGADRLSELDWARADLPAVRVLEQRLSRDS